MQFLYDTQWGRLVSFQASSAGVTPNPLTSPKNLEVARGPGHDHSSDRFFIFIFYSGHIFLSEQRGRNGSLDGKGWRPLPHVYTFTIKVDILFVNGVQAPWILYDTHILRSSVLKTYWMETD